MNIAEKYKQSLLAEMKEHLRQMQENPCPILSHQQNLYAVSDLKFDILRIERTPAIDLWQRLSPEAAEQWLNE